MIVRKSKYLKVKKENEALKKIINRIIVDIIKEFIKRNFLQLSKKDCSSKKALRKRLREFGLMNKQFDRNRDLTIEELLELEKSGVFDWD